MTPTDFEEQILLAPHRDKHQRWAVPSLVIVCANVWLACTSSEGMPSDQRYNGTLYGLVSETAEGRATAEEAFLKGNRPIQYGLAADILETCKGGPSEDCPHVPSGAFLGKWLSGAVSQIEKQLGGEPGVLDEGLLKGIDSLPKLAQLLKNIESSPRQVRQSFNSHYHGLTRDGAALLLAKQLAYSDPTIRAEVLNALRALGPDYGEAVRPALDNLQKNPDEGIRRDAVQIRKELEPVTVNSGSQHVAESAAEKK